MRAGSASCDLQLFDSGTLRRSRRSGRSPEPARAGPVRRGGARPDGATACRRANLDVEPIPDALAPTFAQFVARFAAAVHRRVPGGQVVVALGASESDAGIARSAKRPTIFIMGYDYHWQGSTTPGPIAPLRTGPQTVAIRSPATPSGARPQAHPRRACLRLLVAGRRVRGRVAGPVDLARYGGVRSVTFDSRSRSRSAPKIVRHVTPDGSWFRYWDAVAKTWRESTSRTPRPCARSSGSRSRGARRGRAVDARLRHAWAAGGLDPLRLLGSGGERVLDHDRPVGRPVRQVSLRTRRHPATSAARRMRASQIEICHARLPVIAATTSERSIATTAGPRAVGPSLGVVRRERDGELSVTMA